MYLDVKRLLRPDAEKTSGEEKFNLSTWDFCGYTVPQPVSLAWQAVPVGGAVRLAFKLNAKVQAECARCLGEAWQEVHVEKEYNILEDELQQEFPELPINSTGLLDLQEFAYSELVIEGPIAVLCSPNCEGICQTCGKMKAGCACETEPEGDPRMQVLKQLLKTEENAEQ